MSNTASLPFSTTIGSVVISMNLDTGAVRVAGPDVESWLDLDAALLSARTMAPFAPSVEMAIAQAVHQQFAAWSGLRSIGC